MTSLTAGRLGLLALTVLLGLQSLRVLLPGLTWTVGDRLELASPILGVFALAAFAAAFMVGVFRHRFGEGRGLLITAGGLGLLRLLMQFGWGEPLITIGLSFLAVALFVIFLPLSLEAARRGGEATIFVFGLLLGLTLDTALYGAFFTYDIAWQSGLLPLLAVVFLVAVQWLLLAKGFHKSDEETTDCCPRRWPWLAIGPFLFLELVVFQNIARLAALTGWSLPLAFLITLTSHLLALAVVLWLLSRGNLNRLLVLSCGLILTAACAAPDTSGVWLIAASLLLGQLALCVLMAVAETGLAESGEEHRSLTAPGGLGMVLLVALLLGYYASYQLSLPFSNVILPPLAALLVAAFAFPAARARAVRIGHSLAPVLLAAVLLLLPIFSLFNWQSPQYSEGSGYPVRLMTYNLHNGFNTDGRLDMEALAEVIEDSDPDILALQEVSRGWLVSGRLDMLEWLSQRLEMPYVWGPTSGELWGNAILSRYPITGYQSYELPPRGLPLERGFTSAMIDLGNGQMLKVVANHFHHVAVDSEIRQQQAVVLSDFYGGASYSVFLGDLNAEPDAPEMDILCDTGLVDALGGSHFLTFRSTDPYERIDYIWLSPDLVAFNVFVPSTTASDHLPVVADILPVIY